MIAPRRRLALVVLSITLATQAPGPVNGAWEEDLATSAWLNAWPSTVVDSGNVTHVAFQRLGDAPGIYLATEAGSDWIVERVSDGSDWAPSLAADASDDLHLTFTRVGTDPGLYYATNATGSWVTSRISTDGSAGGSSLAVYGDDVHAVFPVWGAGAGIVHYTDATGAWVRSRLTAAPVDGEPRLAIDGAGKLHVAYARYTPEALGIHYLTNAAGSWADVRVSTSFDDYPALALDGAGKVHIVYGRYATNPGTLRHATNSTGSWVTTAIPHTIDWEGWFGAPTVAFDGDGDLHAAVAVTEDPYYGYASARFLHFELGGGGWAAALSPTFDYYYESRPSLAFTGAGELRVAYARSWPNAGIRLYRSGTDSELVAASESVASPSVRRAPDGTLRIGYERSAEERRLVYAIETGDAWTIEEAPATAFFLTPDAVDLAVHSDGTARMASGQFLASDASAAWATGLIAHNADDTAVAIGTNGIAHFATGPAVSMDGSGFVGYGTCVDATCNLTESVDYALGQVLYGPTQPDIALDASNRPYIAYINSRRVAMARKSAGVWTYVDVAANRSFDGTVDETDSWPAIALDANGKVHIVYAHVSRGDNRMGIYYTTNASGSWVNRQISRSSADGPPAIAIDGAGKVHLAWRRSSVAVAPGVYLATNKSGSWVVTRVSSRDGGNPSLAVTPGGLAIVAWDEFAGVRLLRQTDVVATDGSATGPLRGLDPLQLDLSAMADREAPADPQDAPEDEAPAGLPAREQAMELHPGE